MTSLSFTVSNSNWVRTTAFALIVKQQEKLTCRLLRAFPTSYLSCKHVNQFPEIQQRRKWPGAGPLFIAPLQDAERLNIVKGNADKIPSGGLRPFDNAATGHTSFAITKLQPLSVCEILRSAVAALCRGRLDSASNPSDLYDYPQKSPTNCEGGTGTCPSARTSPSGGSGKISPSFYCRGASAFIRFLASFFS